MKREIMEIIEAHNRTVDAVNNSAVMITGDQAIGVMVIFNQFVREGAEIARAARANGIDCKIDMQGGRIILQEEEKQ